MYRKLVERIQTKVNQEEDLEVVTGNYKGNAFQQTRRIQKKPPKNNITRIMEKKN